MKYLTALPRSTIRYMWMNLLLVLWVTGVVLVPNAAAQSDVGPQLTVLVEALNVRSGPGVTYPSVDLLAQGDEVPVIGQHTASGWWQVQLPDGSTGWVSGGATYVSVNGDTESVPEVSVAVPSTAGIEVTTSSTSVSVREVGGTIVFQTVSGGPIYAVNADGSNLRYLTTGIDPALSPDGQRIAFTRWDDTQNGALGSLWVINVDTLTGTPARVAEPGRAGGSGEQTILPEPRAQAQIGDIHQPKAPAWSPDGSEIAISMQHGGRVEEVRKCGTERPPREAYDVEVKRDNGDIKFCYTLPPHPYWGLRVVNVATGEFEDLPNDLFSYSPAWDPANPDRLVFDGERGLMGLDLDQGTIWTLTDDANDHSPVFSPDGSEIATSYWQNDHWEIHVINSDGTGRVRLTETPVRARLEQMVNGEMPQSWNNAAPTWSPDGSQMAFLTDRSGSWEIWIMDADGSNQQPLLPDEVYDQLQISYNAVDERVLSWGGQ